MSDKETAQWKAAKQIVEQLEVDETMNDEAREYTTNWIHAIITVECGAPAPQLKEILKQYGAHHIRDCDALNKWKKLPCDCGFAALIEGTSKQAPQELELEQETEGRWLAAYTRFPGVAAYGPSKEEAIWNAAKVLIDSEPADTIDDGFGNSWSAYCPTCKQKSMYVSRPGDARCSTCESKQSHEFKPYMEDHEYYDPPQASPTPLEEMCESAIDLAAELRVELRHAVMCMDRSCKQCNAIAKRCGEVERG